MSYRITSYLIISCHIVNYCYIWYHINCREIRLKSKLPAEHFAASFVGLPKVRIASPTPTTITITTTGQNLTFDLPCGSPPSVKSSTWTTSPHCRIESFRQPVMEGTWKPRFIRVIRVCEIVNKSFLCQTKKLCNKNIGHSRPGAGWPVGWQSLRVCQVTVYGLNLRSQAMTTVACFEGFVCFRSKGYDF